eukprot:TRINITY_DN358_c0_g1_i1.p1 TRINITY_DN358_c0_g1~~TRINITY_DN358_c0_g1_i1.p1  ORF type:complete len:147 (+),score=32.64 TRINITY_DN358_c0_g1_i1:186-626(+)
MFALRGIRNAKNGRSLTNKPITKMNSTSLKMKQNKSVFVRTKSDSYWPFTGPTPKVPTHTSEIEDPLLENMMLKLGFLLDTLGVKEGAEEKKFLESYVVSPGHSTSEWALPSPPPFHLFNEPALVKFPEYEDAEPKKAKPSPKPHH